MVKIDQHNVVFKLTLLGQIKSLIEGIGLSQQLQFDESAQTINVAEQTTDPQILPVENRELQNDNSVSLPSESSDNIDAQILTNQEPDVIDNVELSNLQTLYYRWLG